jgi:site-specific recombinase XerD
MTKTTATAPRPVSFASLVQQFFTEYLVTQRALSPRTIASYRDAMLLFLDFAQHRLGKMPTTLNLSDITPELILAFLDHLEQERQNSVRSRNLRLTALRAFLKFAARRDVSSFIVIEHALGVPMKRFERPMLGFMTREEMLAVIGEPGDTWTSQRDHLLLVMLYNTGARVSEIIGVKVSDVVLGESACVHLRGKGRKQRSTPLWKSTVQAIRAWLRRNPSMGKDAALLPNRDANPMTRFNVTQRLNIAVARAAQAHNSLTKRSISPHTIRHTTAMHLLQSGVAFSVIALWLGHESTTTTHRYVEADLAMKEKALARLQEPETQICRYHPADDALMQFLQAL